MKKLLSPQELADYLGLAVQTIYNRHGTGGSLPKCINTGRLIRFHPRDIESWLTEHYEKPPTVCTSLTPEIRRRGRPTKAEQIQRRKSNQQ
jgi:predicted DNA-binding transcriptional regulator AlpA